MQFNGTCRRTLPFEDKVKVNSLHNIEALNKAYLMTTSISPEKLIPSSKLKVSKNAADTLNSFDLRESMEHQKQFKENNRATPDIITEIVEE